MQGNDPAGVVRGTSFGSYWIEVCTAGSDRSGLDTVIAERGRTGPKSLRVDDVLVRLAGDEVEVTIGTTRVGALGAADSARYAPVLARVGCAVESSGIVLIDIEGHPGAHAKLYLPDADMLVPANAIDPTVPLFFALDRAGGVTLAMHKHDHRLIADATASWWPGTSCSAWVFSARSGIELTATARRWPRIGPRCCEPLGTQHIPDNLAYSSRRWSTRSKRDVRSAFGTR